MEQFFVDFSVIRLITHRKIDPILLIYDTFRMRKSIKASLTVIRPHTAFANSAKALFACGKMYLVSFTHPPPKEQSAFISSILFYSERKYTGQEAL